MFPRASVLTGQAPKAFVPSTHLFGDPSSKTPTAVPAETVVAQPRADSVEDVVKSVDQLRLQPQTEIDQSSCFVQASVEEIGPGLIQLDRAVPDHLLTQSVPPYHPNYNPDKLEWDYLVYVSSPLF